MLNQIRNFVERVNELSDWHSRIEAERTRDINDISLAKGKLESEFASYEKSVRADFAVSEEVSEKRLKDSIAVVQKEIDQLNYYLDLRAFRKLKHHIPDRGVRKPNMTNLKETYRNFLYDPFWFKGVNVVTLGTYKRNLADDFVSECEAGINYFNDQIESLRKSRSDERKQREDKLNADIRAKREKLSLDLEPLNIKLKQQNEKHNQTLHSLIFDSQKVSSLHLDLCYTSDKWGLVKNAWEEYVISTEKPSAICLGYARIPVDFSAVAKQYVAESKLAPFYSAESGILAPLCVPLNSNITIEYSDNMRNEVVSGIQGVITRFVRSMPSKGFDVTFIDPIGRGSSLGKLIKLSQVDPHNCPLINDPATTKSKIAEQLKKVVDYIDDTSVLLADMGTTATIENYNAIHTQKLKYKVVIIEDFTEGLDSSFIDYLKVVSSDVAKRCGVITILGVNRKYMPKDSFVSFYGEYKKNSVCICENNGALTSTIGKTTIKVKLVDASKVNEIYLSQVYGEYVKKIELDNSYNRFYGKQNTFEFKDATKALCIPFAVDGETNEMVEMELGGSTTSFAMITGTQGSGKSTTLHALIVGLMANYHPDDVELWLVDYKMTEFATMYRDKRLPHVKYLGLENSPEFTYGILDKVKEEFEKRGKILADNGFQDIKSYMRARKQQIANHESNVLPLLPRIVLIVDEVSNLASHINESQEYKNFFEHMIRTYRAWGLCAVFADQYPIANSRGITDDAQDLIMTRMAMAHTLQHMRTTLSLSSNEFSEELQNDMTNMSSGDIVYKYKVENDDWTTKTIIKKYKSVYLKEDEISGIIDRLNTQLSDGLYTNKQMKTVSNSERVMRDNTQIKRFAKKFPLYDSENIGMYLGTPTSFEECFRFELSSHISNNILVVSSNRDLNYSSIINSIRSFQSYKGNKTIIIAHPKNKLYKRYRDKLIEIPSKNPNVTIIEDIEQVCSCLEFYAAKVKHREEAENTLFVYFGVEEWFEDFAAESGNVTNAVAWSQKDYFNKDDNGNAISDSTIESQMDILKAGGFLDLENDDDDEQGSAGAPINIPIESNTTETRRISLDASEYISSLLRLGSRYNLYSLMTFETSMEFSRVKKVDKDNFSHKIVGAISKNDAYNISFPAAALEAFSTKQIAETNLLYSDGINAPVRFRPYLNN